VLMNNVAAINSAGMIVIIFFIMSPLSEDNYTNYSN